MRDKLAILALALALFLAGCGAGFQPYGLAGVAGSSYYRPYVPVYSNTYSCQAMNGQVMCWPRPPALNRYY
jgi:hypothetical protein